jgi:hypothetical protein
LWLIALPALLLAASEASAVPALHTGSTRYVRIVHLGRGQLSVALTAQGHKRFAQLMHGGYALDATCTTLGKSVQGFSQRGSSGGAEGSVGPHGRPTYHALLDPHADFCDIGRVRLTVTRRSISSEQVAGPTLDSLALTQKGAAFLDEDRVTATTFGVLEVAIGEAQHLADGHFPPADQFAAELRTSPWHVVALASPLAFRRNGERNAHSFCQLRAASGLGLPTAAHVAQSCRNVHRHSNDENGQGSRDRPPQSRGDDRQANQNPGTGGPSKHGPWRSVPQTSPRVACAEHSAGLHNVRVTAALLVDQSDTPDPFPACPLVDVERRRTPPRTGVGVGVSDRAAREARG